MSFLSSTVKWSRSVLLLFLSTIERNALPGLGGRIKLPGIGGRNKLLAGDSDREKAPGLVVNNEPAGEVGHSKRAGEADRNNTPGGPGGIKHPGVSDLSGIPDPILLFVVSSLWTFVARIVVEGEAGRLN